MYSFKKCWKAGKAASMRRLLAVFTVFLSCDLNPPSDQPSNQPPEEPSDVFTAYPVASDPVPEYTFEPEELIGSASSSAYLTPPQPYPSAPLDSYQWFFNYRLEQFSPKTEPLMEERFGRKLGIKKASLWDHNSYNSHAVGFAASLPAISVVEYGETTAYGSHTEVSESYFYNHLHYLKDLKEGTAYHYRVIVRDEDGNTIALPDRTFTTKTFTGEIKQLYQGDFTHEGGRSGIWITSPGVYVLMEDISADGLGINIKAHDVTIDLNGRTLTYDNGANAFNDTNNGYNESASYGIRAGLWNFTNAKIYNGVIKQGKTGSSVREPLFLFHMGNTGATKNEVAGLTVDYYGDDTSGMRTGVGYAHHNLLYDRGNKVTDRHGGVRALLADHNGATEVAYNSLRRFRQNGITNADFVHDNELYSDSFVTNSFALGAGNNAVIKNNKIFGMGYHPIGIGWGNNIHVKDNFIYMWGYAPTHRDPEYARNSSITGMRVTNYNTESTAFNDMLFEGNFIVLKATDNCTLARGIWTINSLKDSNIRYRHNTVKVEAMPGNYIENYNEFSDYYYNGNVNSALAAVTVQGNGWDSEAIPNALVFEDNRLISNVNHIVIGEGYGISSGVRFYRTTLEKIDHDIGRFYGPVRLGFWYWNTLKNHIIDTKLVGVTEDEMTPYFYGGAGKMEVFYGERQTFRFLNGNDRPVANKTITLTMGGDGSTQTRQTNAEGKASFDILSARHFKFGNSLENGGVPGTPERIDYRDYTFSAEGYYPYVLPR